MVYHKIIVQNGTDGWVITKNSFFSLKTWHAASSKLGSVKISEKNSIVRVRKLKFWFQRGVYFGGMGEGEWMLYYAVLWIIYNLICFRECNIHKKVIRCIRITTTSKPPESMAGGDPVCFFLGGEGGGGGGIFVEGSVIICPKKMVSFSGDIVHRWLIICSAVCNTMHTNVADS